jgi:hypothetical protein
MAKVRRLQLIAKKRKTKNANKASAKGTKSKSNRTPVIGLKLSKALNCVDVSRRRGPETWAHCRHWSRRKNGVVSLCGFDAAARLYPGVMAEFPFPKG